MSGQKEDLIATVLASKSSPIHSSTLHYTTELIITLMWWEAKQVGSFLPFSLALSDLQAQSTEELKQQKSYLKLLKKQCKELKELRKKHLKKVRLTHTHTHTHSLSVFLQNLKY